jgi:hypothetical protein
MRLQQRRAPRALVAAALILSALSLTACEGYSVLGGPATLENEDTTIPPNRSMISEYNLNKTSIVSAVVTSKDGGDIRAYLMTLEDEQKFSQTGRIGSYIRFQKGPQANFTASLEPGQYSLVVFNDQRAPRTIHATVEAQPQ